MNCPSPAYEWGCGCAGKCRADIYTPPPPKRPVVNEIVSFVIMAVLIGSAAYVGLSRVEAAYQQDART